MLLELAVRYDDEDISYDFPMRKGDLWKAKVELDTGKIVDWPAGKSGDLYMKVCDEGTYTLLDDAGQKVAAIEQNYVPHGVVPGKYGDYVDLEISEDGTITNWPRKPDLSAFIEGDDD